MRRQPEGRPSLSVERNVPTQSRSRVFYTRNETLIWRAHTSQPGSSIHLLQHSFRSYLAFLK